MRLAAMLRVIRPVTSATSNATGAAVANASFALLMSESAARRFPEDSDSCGRGRHGGIPVSVRPPGLSACPREPLAS